MLDPKLVQLLALLAGTLSVVGIVYVVLYPLIAGPSARDQRLASATESRTRKLQTRSAAETASARRKNIAETLKELEKRNHAKEKVSLRLKLERAGLSPDPNMFWIASAVSGAFFALLALALLPASGFKMALVLLAAFVGTLGVPRFVLGKLIEMRLKKFTRELANAIDVIVRGIKSGLPLNECLNVIANEAPDPISTEFKEVIDQQRIGVPLGEALERMTQRVPLQETKFLAIVIAIQQQSGGNLAEALSNLAGVLRDRFKMSMKVKALASEAVTSGFILGSLPPGIMVMLWLTSPSYVEPLFTTRSGTFFIIVGLFWMSLGILTMRKMINFKF